MSIVLAQLADLFPDWVWWSLFAAGLAGPAGGLVVWAIRRQLAPWTASQRKKKPTVIMVSAAIYYAVVLPLAGAVLVAKVEQPMAVCPFICLMPIGILMGIAFARRRVDSDGREHRLRYFEEASASRRAGLSPARFRKRYDGRRWSTMPVLNYATRSISIRPSRWRWLVAIVVGLGIGLAAGDLSYHPILRAIVGNVQVNVRTIDEFFYAWLRFMAVAGMSGALVGCSSMAAAGRRRMWFGWPIEITIVYFFGASAGLLCARAEWQSQASLATSNWVAAALTGFPGIPANLSYGPLFQLADVPALTAPIYGCVAVVLILGLVTLIRWAFAAANRGAVRN